MNKLRWSRLIFAALFALDTAIEFGAELAVEEPGLQESVKLISFAPTWQQEMSEARITLSGS